MGTIDAVVVTQKNSIANYFHLANPETNLTDQEKYQLAFFFKVMPWFRARENQFLNTATTFRLRRL